MSQRPNVSHWIELVKAGDSEAANQIWQHYFDRLARSVRARLQGQNRAVRDEEDIVVSVLTVSTMRPKRVDSQNYRIDMTCGNYCFAWRRGKWSTNGGTISDNGGAVPSLVVGMIGFTTSLGLYWLALNPGNASAESWKKKFSGKSISSAYLAREEIERTQIS